MELEQFLVWLIAGGSAVAISWIGEQFDWFQALPSNTKRWVQFVGAAVLALGAWSVNKYVPPEVLVSLKEPFVIVAGAFITIILNQVGHANNPARV